MVPLSLNLRNSHEFRTNFVRISCEMRTKFVRIRQIRTKFVRMSARCYECLARCVRINQNIQIRTKFVRISYEFRTNFQTFQISAKLYPKSPEIHACVNLVNSCCVLCRTFTS